MDEAPKTLRHASDYRDHRAEAYPVTGDALDVLADAIKAIINGEPIPPKVHEYLAARDAIKTRFRKP